MIVYLAGYMSAENWTREWRLEAARRLNIIGVQTLDPFRGKQELSETGLKCSHPTSLLTARDKMDIKRSDVMILNALNIERLPRQSIGTWSEYGYAAMSRDIPIIIIGDNESLKSHPFIEKWASLVVPNLDEAIAAVLWLR
jgi:nucleoside 2-deoxyribosyltransferase